jgi:hypothetical protein
VSKKATRQVHLTVVRDEIHLERLRRIGMFIGFGGMIVLVVGFILGLIRPANEILLYQGGALLLGLPMSQAGLFLINKYGRNPRPDRLLDQGLGKVVRNGRIYHFVLPVPHVLLSEFGIYVFLLKWQGGRIRADGDKWHQRIFFMRRLFGIESLGNPTRESKDDVKRLATFMKERNPDLADEQLPIIPVVVFTSNIRDLDISNAALPAFHYTKLRGYMRQQSEGNERLSREAFAAYQAIFDEEAGDVLSQSSEENGADE